VRQALQAASGELRAGIEGSRGGEGVAYEDRRTGARVRARLGRQTDGREDGLADGPNRAKIARFWLVLVKLQLHCSNGAFQFIMVSRSSLCSFLYFSFDAFSTTYVNQYSRNFLVQCGPNT